MMSTATEVRLDDDTAHERARRYAATHLGLQALPDVVWDADHHLQGHFDIAGHRLVLIAPRAADRQPVLLTEGDWDGFRRPWCRNSDAMRGTRPTPWRPLRAAS
jgi:hypothetical protein